MNRPYLFGDMLGPEALPARILLGAIAGAFMGVFGLLIGIGRLIRFVLFDGTSGIQGHWKEAAHAFLALTPPYIAAFSATGIIFGVLAGFRRGIISSALAGFSLGATLYGGIALGDPDAQGSFSSRLTDAREFATLMGALCAVVGAAWYLWDRWRHRRTGA